MKFYLCATLLLGSAIAVESFVDSIKKGIRKFMPKKGDNYEWLNGEKPWFCHDLDCPEFTVVKEFTSNGIKIQERCYQRTEWVSTERTGPSGSGISFNGMFQKLFKYISGENERKEKVPMTAPVLMQVSMDKETKQTNMRMNFFVPPSQEATLPRPTASDVKVTEVPPMCVYVRWYGGWQMGYNDKMKERVGELRDALKAKGLEGTYDENSMMFAGYDSPWRLINRHNEVMVKKL